jgi:hypothetical protein
VNVRKPLAWVAARITGSVLRSMAGLPASARHWIERTFRRGGADRRRSQPTSDRGA